MNIRQQFLQYLAPTTFEPIALPIVKAQKEILFDENNKEYIDLIAGISVCNIGHSHPKVIQAVKNQTEQYMHVMVYGETVHTPQIEYAKALVDKLGHHFSSVYFTNSGTEAVEGAMKLAKRYTGRFEILGFKRSYHGSSQGAMSLLGDEYYKHRYRPLLPNIKHLDYNSYDAIESITDKVACIIMEPIQAEGGVIIPDVKWLQKIREKCNETGTLLIFDEIQTGFGRTGKLFAHQLFGVIPDVILLGKALGGGMPMGAFIADKKVMDSLAYNPILGHMTTFGGHPVCCAAGLAALNVLEDENIVSAVNEKGALFIKHLKHPKIIKIHHIGLMMAVYFESFDVVKALLSRGLKADNAIFSDWFLFTPQAIRIVPPLNISDENIIKACKTIVDILNEM